MRPAGRPAQSSIKWHEIWDGGGNGIRHASYWRIEYACMRRPAKKDPLVFQQQRRRRKVVVSVVSLCGPAGHYLSEIQGITMDYGIHYIITRSSRQAAAAAAGCQTTDPPKLKHARAGSRISM